MNLLGPRMSPDDERYEKLLARRAPVIGPLVAFAFWVVLRLAGAHPSVGLLVFGVVFGIIALPGAARLRRISPEAREAAQLKPAMDELGPIDSFIARAFWPQPVLLVAAWLGAFSFLTLFCFLLVAVSLGDEPLYESIIILSVLGVAFALAAASLMRALWLRRKARRRMPPGAGQSEPLQPP